MKNKIVKKKYLQEKSGSVLVFSLFIMMISLIMGVSLMSTSSVGRKSTLSSAKSVNSFQVADSGIEYVFREIRKYRWNETGGAQGDRNLEDSDNSDIIDAVFSGCTNAGGTYSVSGSLNGGDYTLFFFDSANGAIHCNGSQARLVNIKKIKSVGTYNGITRSVEAYVDFSNL